MAHLVRACVVEMKLDILQKPLHGKFTAKMPGPRWSTLIEHWGYSFCKNGSVWIHCLGNSHPAPIARCFSRTVAVKLFFWQRFRNAHGVLDQAANGCKRLWVVAPKQGFWPKTTWRVTCSKRYTSSLSGVSTPHAEQTYFYTVLMCLTDTFPFCGLLIGCAWKLAACFASSMTEGRPRFALMHNMNVLVKHETFEI